MNILLFWGPLCIALGTLIYLLSDKDIGKLHRIVSRAMTVYIIGIICLFITISIGVDIGMVWTDSMSIKETLLAVLHAYNPLALLPEFATHFEIISIGIIGLTCLITIYVTMIIIYYHGTGLKDYQVISTYVASAWYYEEWTERCTRTVTENGKTRTETYYVHHPPSWQVILGNEHTVSISASDFSNYCTKFGNREFKNLFRLNQSSIGDGNAYYSVWPETESTLIPAAYKEDYLNFITASKNTVLVSDVDESKFTTQLSDDPDIEDSKFGEVEIDRVTTTGILFFDETLAQEIDDNISKWLAKVGVEKGVNVMFYFTDQKIDFWYALHEIRKGGRFNEVLVVIGIDPISKNINWCKTMAWDNIQLCKTIDNKIEELGNISNATKLCDIVKSAVDNDWVKPTMDKYEYLASDIVLPWWYNILAVIIIGLVCIPFVANLYQHSLADIMHETGEFIKNLLNKNN